MNPPISKAQNEIIKLLKKHKGSEIILKGWSPCPRIYANEKFIRTIHTRTFTSMKESGLIKLVDNTFYGEKIYNLRDSL